MPTKLSAQRNLKVNSAPGNPSPRHHQMISPAELWRSCLRVFNRKPRLTLEEINKYTDTVHTDPSMESPERFMVEDDEIVGIVATVSGGKIIPTSEGHFPCGYVPTFLFLSPFHADVYQI